MLSRHFPVQGKRRSRKWWEACGGEGVTGKKQERLVHQLLSKKMWLSIFSLCCLNFVHDKTWLMKNLFKVLDDPCKQQIRLREFKRNWDCRRMLADNQWIPIQNIAINWSNYRCNGSHFLYPLLAIVYCLRDTATGKVEGSKILQNKTEDTVTSNCFMTDTNQPLSLLSNTLILVLVRRIRRQTRSSR